MKEEALSSVSGIGYGNDGDFRFGRRALTALDVDRGGGQRSWKEANKYDKKLERRKKARGKSKDESHKSSGEGRRSRSRSKTQSKAKKKRKKRYSRRYPSSSSLSSSPSSPPSSSSSSSFRSHASMSSKDRDGHSSKLLISSKQHHRSKVMPITSSQGIGSEAFMKEMVSAIDSSIKIQRYYRSWRSRIAAGGVDADGVEINVPMSREERLTCYYLMEEVMDAMLNECFIPEVLVEALVGEGKEYDCSSDSDLGEAADGSEISGRGGKHRRTKRQIRLESSGILEVLLSECCPSLSLDVATEVINDDVSNYLNSRTVVAGAHPLTLIAESMVHECSDQIAMTVAKSSIDDLVVDYMFMKCIENSYASLSIAVIESACVGISSEVLFDIAVEDIAEDICSSVSDEISLDVSSSVLPSVRQSSQSSMTAYTKSLVSSSCAMALLDSAITKSLCRTFASSGSSLSMNVILNTVVNVVICKRLMLILNGVQGSVEGIRKCACVEEIEQVVVRDTGIDVLVEILEREGWKEECIRDKMERELM